MDGAWTAERLDDLRDGMKEGFERADAEFTKVEKRFDNVDKRFDKVEAAIGEVNRTLNRVGSGMLVALIVAFFLGG